MNWTARGGLIVLQIKQLKTRNEQIEGDVVMYTLGWGKSTDTGEMII